MKPDIFDSLEEMKRNGGSVSNSAIQKEETFNKDIIIKSILKLEEPLELYDVDFDGELILSPTFFLTGSRAWNMNTEDSDYDYICELSLFEKTIKRLEHHKLKYIKHKYFSSLYTAGNDGLFNIIALDFYELECWKFATRSIKGMVNEGVLTSVHLNTKNKVYGLFGILKAMERLL